MRLQDLASFYTRENAENFNAFFTSELNNIYYKVEFATIRGQPKLTFNRAEAAHMNSCAGHGLISYNSRGQAKCCYETPVRLRANLRSHAARPKGALSVLVA